MDYLILVVGLVLLTVGADWLTKGCVGMAARFRVPEFVVGLTVMAVGTSMPELTVSAMSALNGSSDMAIGNVTGSNIFNILIILGICALIKPLVFTKEIIRRDILVCIGASLFLAAFTLYVGAERCISRWEGMVLLALYVASTIYAIRTGRNDKADAEAGTTDGGNAEATIGWGKIMAFIVVGLVGLIYGGNLCLNSATAIARAWGVSEAIIAVTVVAAGTSLPELASSVSAVVSKKPSLALGNIIGSNIANILLILGVCGIIKPLTMGGISPIDIWMVVAVAVILLISALVVGVRRITRVEGAIYLAIYVGYVVMLLR
ncbi:MAG: calcium/sodium antiporter [Alistipes sp.]|nr:calcium/sodium antiporter [Alistipes sp.]